jgi:hypothetical protein
MKKNTKIIFSVIIVFILLFSLIFYLYQSQKSSDLTVDDLVEKGIVIDTSLQIGKAYHVKDKVEKIYVFNLPDIKGNHAVDVQNLSTYSAVWFESYPTFPLFFFGDRSSDFTIDKEVKFDLHVEEYIMYLGGATISITSIESGFVYFMLMELQSAIFSGKFSIVSFELNVLNNDTFKLNVTEVLNFNSPSMYWSQVYIDHSDRFKPQPAFMVYSSTGSLIGNFRERNNSMGADEVEVGQYLEFNYKKEAYGNLTIFLGADILPLVTNDPEPYFFDKFVITLVEI